MKINNKKNEDFDPNKIFNRFNFKFKIPENVNFKNKTIEKIEENLSIESSIENILLQNEDPINYAQIKDSLEKKRNVDKSPFAELIDHNLSDYINNADINNRKCNFLSNSWYKNSISDNSSPKEKIISKNPFLNKKLSKGNELRKARIFNKISENDTTLHE